MTTVVTDDDAGSVEEVAEAVADTAEAVADAIADAVEDIVDAVEDGGSGAHSDADLDRWLEVDRRLGSVESTVNDLAMRPSLSYEDVENIVKSNVVATAAAVAEEVAEEVIDESDTLASDEDAEVTIVAPDVDETPRKSSFWRSVW